MAALFDAFSELSKTAVEIVHLALRLDPADGLRFGGSRTNSSVRLNHYPVGDPAPPVSVLSSASSAKPPWVTTPTVDERPVSSRGPSRRADDSDRPDEHSVLPAPGA